MRKQFVVLIASAAALVTSPGATDVNRPYPEHEHDYEHPPSLRYGVAGEQEKRQKYTCPMHPEVMTDHPGNCPKCGMKLARIKAEQRRTLNVEHPTPSSEPAHHTADGMALPRHEHEHEHEMSMRSSVNIGDPMTRESSGTAWVPDSTPMYGRMFMLGDNMLMLHGGIFPRYTNVSTRRGDDRIDAPNWFMGMFSHPLGDSAQIGARLMMSLDPLTEQGRGYPLLFQSGESWNDRPLHDRQHPHDLFDELSISYSQKFDLDLSAYLYFGYPGEPALGPPTFMHRASAMDNPDAPLGHHWQDSTHITFGVATAGLQWSRLGGLKIESSVFTGREPDEDRYDFDRPRFDSFSGRVSWNPTANLALQFSHGYIKSPEALEPDLKRHRTTASMVYNRPLGHDSNWSNTFVWGQNHDTSEGKTQSFLVESNYQRGRDTIFARWECVEKSGHELVLGDVDPAKIFTIRAYTLGYVHDFLHGNGIDIGLGTQFTINDFPDRLDRYYGDDLGYAFEFYLRIRPSLHTHSAHEHSAQNVAGTEK